MATNADGTKLRLLYACKLADGRIKKIQPTEITTVELFEQTLTDPDLKGYIEDLLSRVVLGPILGLIITNKPKPPSERLRFAGKVNIGG